jgi:hypothetical protein
MPRREVNYNNISSIVITDHNGKGYSAVIRMKNEQFDTIFTQANKDYLYELIERYVFYACKHTSIV